MERAVGVRPDRGSVLHDAGFPGAAADRRRGVRSRSTGDWRLGSRCNDRGSLGTRPRFVVAGVGTSRYRRRRPVVLLLQRIIASCVRCEADALAKIHRSGPRRRSRQSRDSGAHLEPAAKQPGHEPRCCRRPLREVSIPRAGVAAARCARGTRAPDVRLHGRITPRRTFSNGSSSDAGSRLRRGYGGREEGKCRSPRAGYEACRWQ